jgi:hypothetical protein
MPAAANHGAMSLGVGGGAHGMSSAGGLAASPSGQPAFWATTPDSGTDRPQQVPGASDPAAQANQGQQGIGGGMMGGMGGMGRQGGGDQEHKPKVRLSGDIRDILGKPERTTPPVIGED